MLIKRLILFITMFAIFEYSLCQEVIPDIAPAKYHSHQMCVKIVNLSDFNNVIVLSAETNFNGKPTIRKVVDDSCIMTSYKFHVIDLYWITKSRFVELGGIENISFRTLKWKNGGAEFEKMIPNDLHLLIDGINPMKRYYDKEKNDEKVIEIQCNLYKDQFSKISFFISKIISEYVDNGVTKIKTEIFKNDPNIQLTQKTRLSDDGRY